MSIRRDYKSVSRRQRRQSVRRLGILVITLILIGFFGGLLAYIKGARFQQPPPVAVGPPPIPLTPPAPVVAQPPPTPPVSMPEPAADPSKPKYDFYTELPKRQVDIQREEP